MDVSRAKYLVSAAGRAALASLDPGLHRLDPVRRQTQLRRTFAPLEASALAEQVDLQAKARERFGSSPLVLYSAAGLQMMTHPLVAARRAKRLAETGVPVFDVTCGIGGDLHALAASGRTVIGVERDPATALIAQANVPDAHVIVGDATRLPVAISRGAAFVDPARRDGVRRSSDPAAYSPPLDVALALAGAAKAGVVKTAPGLDHAVVPPAAEVEFVEVGRSLREAASWLGAGAVAGLRRAVLLPEGAELTSIDEPASAEPRSLGAFLFDPQSCATRAGLVLQAGRRVAGQLLDPQVAYLTGDDVAFDPFVDTFEVLASIEFSVQRLKALLVANRWRPDEIRRRAFPVEPDELRRLLNVRTGEPVTILCTTIAGQRTAIVARRCRGTAQGYRQ